MGIIIIIHNNNDIIMVLGGLKALTQVKFSTWQAFYKC